MKVLITGKGGRENALAWKISKSSYVTHVFVAPGNPGCSLIDKVTNVNLIAPDDLIKFANEEEIDLTIVGSEDLLVGGIADRFISNGRMIFGPDKKSAQLEGSKAFAKQFMEKYGVMTAKYRVLNEYDAAVNYLDEMDYPLVIKASGLAAGKGVIIALNKDEAISALDAILVQKVFGEAGKEVVIEEYLEGVEASMLCVTDCQTILPLISAKDHKKIGEGETGPNTGGMGAIAPNPYMNEANYQMFIDDILNPTLRGIQMEGMDFAGVIFFGLMMTRKGVYLLEYNMRMGDPETQAILPLLKSDLTDLLMAACEKKLENYTLDWNSQSSCCIVASQMGYPGKCANGITIDGVTEFDIPECLLFAAGVGKNGESLVTNGGRVLNVVALGKNLDEARQKAYGAMETVNFSNKYIRMDIGVIK